MRAGGRNPRITAATWGSVGLLAAALAIGLAIALGQGSAEPEAIGRILVLLLYWGGAVVVCALFPGLSSVSLVAERERKALDLVEVTALRPGDIVLGTAAASLAQGTLVLVALAPLLVLALVFGGVPPWVVLLLVALLASGAVLAVALGVLASATSRTAVRAVLGAYLSTILLVGGGSPGPAPGSPCCSRPRPEASSGG